jgi:hypothetical protein
MKSPQEKINTEDWKSKSDLIPLDDLKASGMVGSPPYDDSSKEFKKKNSTEKKLAIKKYDVRKRIELLELIKGFSYKNNNLYPDSNLFTVTATVGEFKKLAENEAVGSIFLSHVHNAINLAKTKHKEWVKTKQIFVVKVELVPLSKLDKKKKQVELWMLKAISWQIAFEEAKKYFKKYYEKPYKGKVPKILEKFYSKGYTGRIIDYRTDDMDNIENFTRTASAISLWDSRYEMIKAKHRKANKYQDFTLTL